MQHKALLEELVDNYEDCFNEFDLKQLAKDNDVKVSDLLLSKTKIFGNQEEKDNIAKYKEEVFDRILHATYLYMDSYNAITDYELKEGLYKVIGSNFPEIKNAKDFWKVFLRIKLNENKTFLSNFRSEGIEETIVDYVSFKEKNELPKDFLKARIFTRNISDRVIYLNSLVNGIEKKETNEVYREVEIQEEEKEYILRFEENDSDYLFMKKWKLKSSVPINANEKLSNEPLIPFYDAINTMIEKNEISQTLGYFLKESKFVRKISRNAYMDVNVSENMVYESDVRNIVSTYLNNKEFRKILDDIIK